MTPAKLKALLKRKDMTQTLFADQAGVSDAFLSRYLAGKVKYDREMTPHIRLQRHYNALAAE